jgi:hypothetical protein
MGTVPTTMAEILDREQIIACLHRYARGVDRHDAELIRSTYHEDAIDDHGFHVGSRDEFCTWVMEVHAGAARHQHYVTNYTIDLDGDVAHVESYYIATMLPHDEDRLLQTSGGRYIDRFEKRRGEWRIALRVAVNEWQQRVEPTQKAGRIAPVVHQSPEDLSYRRPLSRPLP